MRGGIHLGIRLGVVVYLGLPPPKPPGEEPEEGGRRLAMHRTYSVHTIQFYMWHKKVHSQQSPVSLETLPSSEARGWAG